VALLLLAASGALAQGDVDAAADSLVHRDSLLFEPAVTVPDEPMGDEEHDNIPGSRYRLYQATPEFSVRYGREDLLGLRDRLFVIGYDRADGFYIGAGADLAAHHFLEKRLQGYVGGGYAFGSHYWQVSGGLSRDLLAEEYPLRVGVEAHIMTDTKDAWKLGVVENTLFAALAGIDARDYFQRRGFSLTLQQFLEPRSSVSAEYRRDNYRNSRREAGWSLFGPEQPFHEVPPVREGAFSSAVISVATDYMTLRDWRAPQFGFAAQLELGLGEETFRQLVVDARLKSVLVSQFAWLGLHLRLGSASNDAPPQKRFTIGGFGTLPGYPQNAYEGDRMMLLQTELLVAPHKSLRNLRIILSNDFGAVASVPGEGLLSGIPTDPAHYLHSVGIYLGTPAARFRIGAAWRTDRSGPPTFVVRLAQRF
jgi:hypothetical protein